MSGGKLVFTKGYPLSLKASGINEVLLSVGGNVGAVKKRFQALLRQLQHHPLVHVVSTSPLFVNPPQGFENQPDFHNAVIRLRTDRGLNWVFGFIRYLERRFGRQRSFPNAPRTLDLDIIFFNDCKVRFDWLRIPHPKWQERTFVTIPLMLDGCHEVSHI